MFTLSVLKACLAGCRIFGPDIIAVEEDKRRQEVEEHPEQDDVPDQQPEHMDAEVEQQVEEVAEETRGEEPVENADLSVTDLLIRVNMQKLQNIFEEEEIKMQTLTTSTATHSCFVEKFKIGKINGKTILTLFRPSRAPEQTS